ncbi:deoxyribodipyrimidine photo-lyase [Caenispirillum bisanense]|uniref:cryptochrome/photolyase family protein n=1 Tax=Caenispirillum bisanense TaxID=414052 RepID=UPI0031E1838D
MPASPTAASGGASHVAASGGAPVIVLFRDDLRIADHPALHAAAARGVPVLPVFVVDCDHGLGEGPQARPLGGAVRWWLHHSLASLGERLAALGAPLVLRGGRPAEVVPQLAAEDGAAAVLVNHSLNPALAESERLLGERLAALGCRLEVMPHDHIVDPHGLRTGGGRVFQVFTPFWKAVRATVTPPPPLPAPEALRPLPAPPAGAPLESFRLLPTRPDWAGGLRETWTPGEDAAWQALEDFLGRRIVSYRTGRNIPAEPATSRLSPHLRFGEITVRQVWHAVTATGDSAGAEHFLSELGWREFSVYQGVHAPDMARRSLRHSYDAFPWRQAPADLAAWQQGRTGYPIVDAGMRELWHTGWMHNRVRMIVGSFLVKDLLLSWQSGEEWFHDTLVDAHWASNAASWQWVAGCGADAAPYFRVFNPVLQGEKFDPRGQYVRRWVPELRSISDRLIHRPWESPLELAATGYPQPMVDHGAARHRALAAWRSIKEEAEE